LSFVARLTLMLDSLQNAQMSALESQEVNLGVGSSLASICNSTEDWHSFQWSKYLFCSLP